MLENTWYKLRHQKDFTVGYLGGSITCGAGASNAEFTSWRALSRQWLRDNFPDVRVHELYACIGGTGSELGVFRCDHDVCEQKPDLLFYEFATNDGGYGGSYARVLANTEAIVRKVLTGSPTCDIVMFYTNTDERPSFADGEMPPSVRKAQEEVARRYELPEVDVGRALREEIMRRGGDFLTLTRDKVHPNDEGYAIHFDLLKKEILSCLTEERENVSLHLHPMPPVLLPDNPKMNAHLMDACAVPHSGDWESSAESLCDMYPHYLTSDKPGAVLRVPFAGTQIGIYWMKAHDSGDIRYRVDGGEWQTKSSFDKYCIVFDRPCSAVLAEGLVYDEHILEIELLDTVPEKSKGTRQRISAFLVC